MQFLSALSCLQWHFPQKSPLIVPPEKIIREWTKSWGIITADYKEVAVQAKLYLWIPGNRTRICKGWKVKAPKAETLARNRRAVYRSAQCVDYCHLNTWHAAGPSYHDESAGKIRSLFCMTMDPSPSMLQDTFDRIGILLLDPLVNLWISLDSAKDLMYWIIFKSRQSIRIALCPPIECCTKYYAHKRSWIGTLSHTFTHSFPTAVEGFAEV
jgi:hypothetical protein